VGLIHGQSCALGCAKGRNEKKRNDMSKKVGRINGQAEDHDCRVEQVTDGAIEETRKGIVRGCDADGRLPYTHAVSLQFMPLSCLRSSAHRSLKVSLDEAGDLLEPTLPSGGL
jgi:hypothetical protein